MKKIRGISWKDSKGSRKYQESNIELVVPVLASAFLSVACMFIFMYAARIILGDIYPDTADTAVGIIPLAIVALVISCGMEVKNTRFKKIGYGICIGLFAVGVIYAIYYIRDGYNLRKLQLGIEKFVSLYVLDWNRYYGTSIQFYSTTAKYLTMTIDVIWVGAALLLLWIGKLLGKNTVMAALPILVLIGELVVGLSPDWGGLFLLLLGILIAGAIRWRKPEFYLARGDRRGGGGYLVFFRWIIAAVGVCLVFLMVHLSGKPSAQKLIENSPAIRENVTNMVNNLLEGVFNYSWGNNAESDTEELDNTSPQYNNELILTIRFMGLTGGEVYLKGFCGTDYEDSEWIRDRKRFERACKSAGYDVEDMSKTIMGMASNRLTIYNGMHDLSESVDGRTFEIEYQRYGNNRAYVPYFVKPDADKIVADGDGRYVRVSDKTILRLNMWRHEGEYEEYLDHMNHIPLNEKEKWYERFVYDNYTEVPKELDSVREIAAKIKVPGYDYDSLRPGDMARDDVVMYSDNQRTLYTAYAVAEWLAVNATYSLELPVLPGGEDPINYFLGVSRQGYCMHFASAGVMILRQLGIPARYVSGYIVPLSAMQPMIGSYKADVYDNMSHAWAEVYLSGVGWVPIEMTKAYGNQTDVDVPPVEFESPTEAESDVAEPGTEPDDNTEPDTDETQEEPSTNEPQTNESDGKGKGSGAIIAIIILAVIAVAVGLIILLVYKAVRGYRKHLDKLVSKKKARQAVMLINRRIYVKERFRRNGLRKGLNDQQYEEYLKEAYPQILHGDWEHYMEIAKKASFSKSRITEDEMNFCYNIYKKYKQ